MQDLRAELLAQLPSYTTALSPALTVSLVSSVADDQLRTAFWQLIDTSTSDQASRFALTEQCLQTPHSPLLHDGCLDTIALEATQSALSAPNSTGRLLATRAITLSGPLSVDAQHTILALVCTAIHDQVDDLLNGSDVVVSDAALDIFAAYAAKAGDEVVQSDIHLDALVSIHHLTHLLPRESMEEFEVPKTATEVWAGVKCLREEARGVMQKRVDAALAEMLGQTSCRIQCVHHSQ